MTKTPDMTKALQDMMAAFPPAFAMDTAGLQTAFKAQAAFAEKLSGVALAAAEKSTEITSKWAKDSLARIAAASKTKLEPTDYSKAATDFATEASELAAENLAAFAEVAKKAQLDTVELMMAAGKSASEEASAVVKKATADVTAAAKKVAATDK